MGKIRDFFNKILGRNSQKLLAENNNPSRLEMLRYNLEYYSVSSDNLIEEMKVNGELNDLAQDLKQVESIPMYPSQVHGMSHTKRVMFNVSALSMIDGLSKNDRNLLMTAAKLHDIGRSNDYKDDNHGLVSSRLSDKYLANYSNEDRQLIKFIIEQHSVPDEYNMQAIKSLPVNMQNRYLTMMNYLKDADKLDRVRIMPRNNLSDPRLGDLDINRLSTFTAKKLAYISAENFRKGNSLFSDILEKGTTNANMLGYQVDPKYVKDVVQFMNYYGLGISEQEVENNYLMFKSIGDQGKFQYLQTLPIEFRNPNAMQIMRSISEIDFNKLPPSIVDYYGYGSIIDAASYIQPNKVREMQLKGNNMMEVFSTENISFDKKSMDDIFSRINAVSTDCELMRESFDNQAFLWYKLGCYGRVEEYVTQNEYNVTGLGDAVKVLDRLGNDKVTELEQNYGANLPIIVKLTSSLNGKELEEALNSNRLQKALFNYQKYQMDSYAVKGRHLQKIHYDVMDLNLLADMPENLNPNEIYLVKEFIEDHHNKKVPVNCYQDYLNYNYNVNLKFKEEIKDINEPETLSRKILFKKFKDQSKLIDTIYFYDKYMPEGIEKSAEYSILKTIIDSKDPDKIKEAYDVMIQRMPNGEYFDSFIMGMDMALDTTSKRDFVVESSKTKGIVDSKQTQYTPSGTPYIKLGVDDEFTFNVSSLVPRCSAITRKLTEKYTSTKEDFANQKKRLEQTAEEYLHDELLQIQHSLMKNRNQICTSTISKEFLGHAGPGFGKENEVIAAYAPKRVEDIGVMGSEDLGTTFDIKDPSDPNRRRVASHDSSPRSKKVKDLLGNTIEEHSEVVIDGFPEYIICFDEINQRSEDFSKMYNIPLVLIDAKECEKGQESILEDLLDREIPKELESRGGIDEEFERKYLNTVDLSHNIFARVRQLMASQTWKHKEYDSGKMAEFVNRLSNDTEIMRSKATPAQKAVIAEAYDVVFRKKTRQYDQLYLNTDEVEDLRDTVAGKTKSDNSQTIDRINKIIDR